MLEGEHDDVSQPVKLSIWTCWWRSFPQDSLREDDFDTPGGFARFPVRLLEDLFVEAGKSKMLIATVCKVSAHATA